MKKTISLLLILALSSLVFQACEKEEERKVVNKIVDINLNMNESYSGVLKESTYGDELKISKQASHYATSTLTEIQKNKKDRESEESSIYKYTPARNYVGDDEVTIIGEGEEQDMDCDRNENNRGEDKEGKNNDHDDDDDDEMTIITTIRFHIVNNPIKN